jgi:hypothetical protein
MIRQQITVLRERPNGEVLRRFQTKAGFRVFYEKHTGLYYLDYPVVRFFGALEIALKIVVLPIILIIVLITSIKDDMKFSRKSRE